MEWVVPVASACSIAIGAVIIGGIMRSKKVLFEPCTLRGHYFACIEGSLIIEAGLTKEHAVLKQVSPPAGMTHEGGVVRLELESCPGTYLHAGGKGDEGIVDFTTDGDDPHCIFRITHSLLGANDTVSLPPPHSRP
jgi:hypothetical protein